MADVGMLKPADARILTFPAKANVRIVSFESGRGVFVEIDGVVKAAVQAVVSTPYPLELLVDPQPPIQARDLPPVSPRTAEEWAEAIYRCPAGLGRGIGLHELAIAIHSQAIVDGIVLARRWLRDGRGAPAGE